MVTTRLRKPRCNIFMIRLLNSQALTSMQVPLKNIFTIRGKFSSSLTISP